VRLLGTATDRRGRHVRPPHLAPVHVSESVFSAEIDCSTNQRSSGVSGSFA
jgi:hypothetical protein